MSNLRSYVFINNQKVEIQSRGISKDKLIQKSKIINYTHKR